MSVLLRMHDLTPGKRVGRVKLGPRVISSITFARSKKYQINDRYPEPVAKFFHQMQQKLIGVI